MPKYDPVGKKCSGGPQTGTRALMAAILEFFPGATNVGIYNCRNVGGSSSLSVHAEGRAGDNGFVGKDPSPIGFKLADWLVENADHLGIQTVIWNRRIWGGGRGFSWRPYRGQSPHIDHVHWENNWAAARTLTRAHIDKVKPGQTPQPQPPSKEDNDMFIFGIKSDDPAKGGVWFHCGGGKALHIPSPKDIDALKRGGVPDAGELSVDFLARFERVHPRLPDSMPVQH